MSPEHFIPLLAGLLFAPLLVGIVNRIKAIFAGRKGVPLLQLYHDLIKLFRKTPVYSGTTTWIFRAGPVIGLGCVVAALTLVPLGSSRPLLSFPGDFLLVLYLLALMRFLTMAGALDTGSSFEGMGSAREAVFSALAEPVIFLAIGTVALDTRTYTLSGMLPAFQQQSGVPVQSLPVFVLIVVAFLVIMLVENARIPVDDPNTHLELTMIHEVMVLDNSGPDLGFILYGAALKLWLFGAIIVGIILPEIQNPLVSIPVSLLCMAGIGIIIGSIESVMARLRLVKIPQLIAGAGTLALLALLLTLR